MDSRGGVRRKYTHREILFVLAGAYAMWSSPTIAQNFRQSFPNHGHEFGTHQVRYIKQRYRGDPEFAALPANPYDAVTISGPQEATSTALAAPATLAPAALTTATPTAVPSASADTLSGRVFGGPSSENVTSPQNFRPPSSEIASDPSQTTIATPNTEPERLTFTLPFHPVSRATEQPPVDTDEPSIPKIEDDNAYSYAILESVETESDGAMSQRNNRGRPAQGQGSSNSGPSGGDDNNPLRGPSFQGQNDFTRASSSQGQNDFTRGSSAQAQNASTANRPTQGQGAANAGFQAGGPSQDPSDRNTVGGWTKKPGPVLPGPGYYEQLARQNGLIPSDPNRDPTYDSQEFISPTLYPNQTRTSVDEDGVRTTVITRRDGRREYITTYPIETDWQPVTEENDPWSPRMNRLWQVVKYIRTKGHPNYNVGPVPTEEELQEARDFMANRRPPPELVDQVRRYGVRNKIEQRRLQEEREQAAAAAAAGAGAPNYNFGAVAGVGAGPGAGMNMGYNMGNQQAAVAAATAGGSGMNLNFNMGNHQQQAAGMAGLGPNGFPIHPSTGLEVTTAPGWSQEHLYSWDPTGFWYGGLHDHCRIPRNHRHNLDGTITFAGHYEAIVAFDAYHQNRNAGEVALWGRPLVPSPRPAAAEEEEEYYDEDMEQGEEQYDEDMEQGEEEDDEEGDEESDEGEAGDEDYEDEL